MRTDNGAMQTDNGDVQVPVAEGDSIPADMLKGAVAGAVGVWVMDQVDWYMYNHEGAEARERTQSVRPGGMDPAHVMANTAADAMGAELSPRQPHPTGVALHYALGVGPGALYGAMRGRVPVVGAGRGLLYGFALFAGQDEGINAITRLAADPRKYPWQAHARGLVAHLVYGLVTDTVLSLLKGPGRPTRYPQPAENARGEARGYSDPARYRNEPDEARFAGRA